MRATVVVLGSILAAFGCKGSDYKKIGEKCKADSQCETAHYCVSGIEADHRVCTLRCGPDRMTATIDPDTTQRPAPCPDGWSCSAMMNLELTDGTAAWAGLADAPVCVPDGWKPPPAR